MTTDHPPSHQHRPRPQLERRPLKDIRAEVEALLRQVSLVAPRCQCADTAMRQTREISEEEAAAMDDINNPERMES